MSQMVDAAYLLPEAPLSEAERIVQDAGRLDVLVTSLSAQIADYLRNGRRHQTTPAYWDTSQPLLVGLLGPLGQGKSTVLKAVEQRVRDCARVPVPGRSDAPRSPRIGWLNISHIRPDALEHYFWTQLLLHFAVGRNKIYLWLAGLGVAAVTFWWSSDLSVAAAAASLTKGSSGLAAWAAASLGLAALPLILLALELVLGLGKQWLGIDAGWFDRLIYALTDWAGVWPDVLFVDDLDRARTDQQRALLWVLHKRARTLRCAVIVAFDETELLATRPDPESPEELLRKLLLVSFRMPARTVEDTAILAGSLCKELGRLQRKRSPHLSDLISDARSVGALSRVSSLVRQRTPRRLKSILQDTVLRALRSSIDGTQSHHLEDFAALMLLCALDQEAPLLVRDGQRLTEVLELGTRGAIDRFILATTDAGFRRDVIVRLIGAAPSFVPAHTGWRRLVSEQYSPTTTWACRAVRLAWWQPARREGLTIRRSALLLRVACVGWSTLISRASAGFGVPADPRAMWSAMLARSLNVADAVSALRLDEHDVAWLIDPSNQPTQADLFSIGWPVVTAWIVDVDVPLQRWRAYGAINELLGRDMDDREARSQWQREVLRLWISDADVLESMPEEAVTALLDLAEEADALWLSLVATSRQSDQLHEAIWPRFFRPGVSSDLPRIEWVRRSLRDWPPQVATVSAIATRSDAEVAVAVWPPPVGNTCDELRTSLNNHIRAYAAHFPLMREPPAPPALLALFGSDRSYMVGAKDWLDLLIPLVKPHSRWLPSRWAGFSSPVPRPIADMLKLAAPWPALYDDQKLVMLCVAMFELRGELPQCRPQIAGVLANLGATELPWEFVTFLIDPSRSLRAVDIWDRRANDRGRGVTLRLWLSSCRAAMEKMRHIDPERAAEWIMSVRKQLQPWRWRGLSEVERSLAGSLDWYFGEHVAFATAWRDFQDWEWEVVSNSERHGSWPRECAALAIRWIELANRTDGSSRIDERNILYSRAFRILGQPNLGLSWRFVDVAPLMAQCDALVEAKLAEHVGEQLQARLVAALDASRRILLSTPPSFRAIDFSKVQGLTELARYVAYLSVDLPDDDVWATDEAKTRVEAFSMAVEVDLRDDYRERSWDEIHSARVRSAAE